MRHFHHNAILLSYLLVLCMPHTVSAQNDDQDVDFYTIFTVDTRCPPSENLVGKTVEGYFEDVKQVLDLAQEHYGPLSSFETSKTSSIPLKHADYVAGASSYAKLWNNPKQVDPISGCHVDNVTRTCPERYWHSL